MENLRSVPGVNVTDGVPLVNPTIPPKAGVTSFRKERFALIEITAKIEFASVLPVPTLLTVVVKRMSLPGVANGFSAVGLNTSEAVATASCAVPAAVATAENSDVMSHAPPTVRRVAVAEMISPMLTGTSVVSVPV